MPTHIHRAPRQPIHGTQVARRAGAAAGFSLGALAGADEIAASPLAVRLLPAGVVDHVVPALQKTSGLTQPLRAASKWGAAALTRVTPALGYAVYWPSKVGDFAAAGYAILVDKVPWANEQALALRSPYAAYPNDCDWQLPDAQCPAPGSYVRAAQLAPYMYTVAAVVAGTFIATKLAPALWTLSAPTLALLPEGGFGLIPPLYQGAVTSLGNQARRTTQELLDVRAAARAEREEAAQAGRPVDEERASVPDAQVEPAEPTATEQTPLLALRAP